LQGTQQKRIAVSIDNINNIVTKYSFATKGGMSASNPYKQNQDAYLTNPHILGLRHCHFFSVCDGHGTNGREVSSFLKQNLPLNIESSLISNDIN
jgi:serine/threonine protein phosphatase PrpC